MVVVAEVMAADITKVDIVKVESTANGACPRIVYVNPPPALREIPAG